MGEHIVLDPTHATAVAAAIFQAWGTRPEDARTVAEHLVQNDRCGVASHGLLRVPQYVAEIERGEIDTEAQPLVRESPGDAHTVIEARRCFGPVACGLAVELAATRCTDHGVAVVSVLQAGHAGRIGAYPEALARRGLVGLAVCSGPRSGHRVAPFGGTQGRLATNPIAYALSTGSELVSADFSTSAVPEGKVRLLAQLGRTALPGSLLDATGSETDDPDVLYKTPPGTIQPLGGRHFGHKGTALGLLVEVLATLYGGEDGTDPDRVGNNVTLLAFRPPASFAAHAARLVDYLRSSPPADPDRPVMLPGGPEAARRAQPQLRLARVTWEQVVQTAARRGLAVRETAS